MGAATDTGGWCCRSHRHSRCLPPCGGEPAGNHSAPMPCASRQSSRDCTLRRINKFKSWSGSWSGWWWVLGRVGGRVHGRVHLRVVGAGWQHAGGGAVQALCHHLGHNRFLYAQCDLRNDDLFRQEFKRADGLCLYLLKQCIRHKQPPKMISPFLCAALAAASSTPQPRTHTGGPSPYSYALMQAAVKWHARDMASHLVDGNHTVLCVEPLGGGVVRVTTVTPGEPIVLREPARTPW